MVEGSHSIGPLLQEEVLEILAERIACRVLSQLTELRCPTPHAVGGELKTVDKCAERVGGSAA